MSLRIERIVSLWCARTSRARAHVGTVTARLCAFADGAYVGIMIDREIPVTERRHVFAELSQLHRGAIITLRVNGRDVVSGQPLRGISCDGSSVVVHVGNGDRSLHYGHRVARVGTIHVQQTDEGADAAVDMLSADGTKTIVRFRSPMLPELLDPAVE